MSLIYLDSVIPIYLIEGKSPFRVRAETHYQSLLTSGHVTVISELTKLECRIGPLRSGNAIDRASFELFFASQLIVSLTVAVYERATSIRADYGFKLGDALHLAAAVENGCGRFLTNDQRLARFRDITVEILS